MIGPAKADPPPPTARKRSACLEPAWNSCILQWGHSRSLAYFENPQRLVSSDFLIFFFYSWICVVVPRARPPPCVRVARCSSADRDTRARLEPGMYLLWIQLPWTTVSSGRRRRYAASQSLFHGREMWRLHMIGRYHLVETVQGEDSGYRPQNSCANIFSPALSIHTYTYI